MKLLKPRKKTQANGTNGVGINLEPLKLSLYEIAGEDGFVSEKAEEIYNMTSEAFHQNRQVVLSFENTEEMAPAFRNIILGLLLENFDEETIDRLLSYENISDSVRKSIKFNKERIKFAIEYPEAHARSLEDVL